MNLRSNKKEVVLSRLKKTAAQIWGYQESETEGFDPLVDLLLGACAAEFERLSLEQYRSQTRILEKVAEILLPEVYLRPNPSYAVLQGKPVKAERLTQQADQFVFEKEFTSKSGGKPEKKKIFFSPVPGFRLIDAEVAIMATNLEIMQVTDFLKRNMLIRSTSKTPPSENKIWIGLRIHKSIYSLENVSLYFDWYNNPERADLIKLLQLAKWKIDGKRIEVKNGFNREIDTKYDSVISDITSFLDINTKTEKKINHFFEEQFLTINENVLPQSIIYPPEFNDLFNKEELENLKEELNWIEIEFPEIFPSDQLTSTFCTINVFPIINRKIHESNRPYSLNKDLNIIPIITEDFFYSIQKILSENQIIYKEVPYKKVSDISYGTYTIRTEGVKRFDDRNAYDFMQYLIELLREEHVAFKAFGNSMLDKELEELQIIINRLNLNVSKSNNLTNNTHFAILKSETEEDVWIEYWSTTGTFANNIPVGTASVNTDFDKKSLILLSTTTGGKDPPDQAEKITIFKNQLLTQNRIVTSEDIKLACMAELGHEIKDVKISHKPLLSNSRHKGFQNCINVQLQFKRGIDEEEKKNLINHIEKVLQQRSSCIYMYNVVTDSET